MRKIVLMALCFLVLGSTAFAKDLVIGGGGLFGLTFEEYEYPASPGYLPTTHEVTEKAFGGYVFFGLSLYMEASIAVFFNKNTVVWKWYDQNEEIYKEESHPDYPGQQVGVSLYGKWPFNLTDKLAIFPTLGLDLESQNGTMDLFLGGGVGLDYFLGKNLFLRAQGLYRAGALYIYRGENISKGIKTTFPAHGPLFKLGLGWVY